jgi:hypothetical protein
MYQKLEQNLTELNQEQKELNQEQKELILEHKELDENIDNIKLSQYIIIGIALVITIIVFIYNYIKKRKIYSEKFDTLKFIFGQNVCKNDESMSKLSNIGETSITSKTSKSSDKGDTGNISKSSDTSYGNDNI